MRRHHSHVCPLINQVNFYRGAIKSILTGMAHTRPEPNRTQYRKALLNQSISVIIDVCTETKGYYKTTPTQPQSIHPAAL